MTSLPLAQILSQLAPQPDGTLIPPKAENWMQGRTTFGGLTAAWLLEAALRSQDDLPPLRTAMINYVGPISEPPHLSTEVLRTGRNVSTLNARAESEGKVLGTGAFSFGRAVPDAQIHQELPAPEAPAPEENELYIPAGAEHLGPGFIQNFDVRLIDGNRPMMGAKEGYVRAWCRHKDPASRVGLPSLICIGDLLPPGMFPMLRKFGPNSSMNWLVNFMDDNPQTEEGWWQMETRMTAAANGYSSQIMRLWNSAGKLTLEGMQSVIVFA